MYKTRVFFLLTINSVVLYSLVLFFLRDLDFNRWLVLASAMLILAIAPNLIIYSSLQSLRRKVKEANHQVLSRDSELLALKQRFSTLVHLDALTGCYNESYFLDVLRESIEMSDRGDYVFTLAIIRCDQFIEVLDQYGLSQGNRALKLYVGAVSKVLRDTDTIARLGADKFGLILSETSEKDSALVFKRISKSISHLRLVKKQYTTATNTGGIASYYRGDTPEVLLSRAKTALHSAIDKGKGGFIVSDSVP